MTPPDKCSTSSMPSYESFLLTMSVEEPMHQPPLTRAHQAARLVLVLPIYIPLHLVMLPYSG